MFQSFNRGAMRQCYRLKKLSKFCNSEDWHHAGNYVAKKYMESVDRSVYFEDVKLQMDAKLWGEEYNRHNPPKKIDIFQMYIIELIDEEGSPLYHLEHFIEVSIPMRGISLSILNIQTIVSSEFGVEYHC